MAKQPAIVAATNSDAEENSETTKLSNRDRFLKLAPLRMTNAIEKIALVARLANFASYEYTKEEAERIMAALDLACVDVDNAFRKQLENPSQRPARTRKLFKL